jgi:hypothetical protein
MPSSKMDDHQRRLDSASPTATDPTEADTRPGCGATTGARSPQPSSGLTPRVPYRGGSARWPTMRPRAAGRPAAGATVTPAVTVRFPLDQVVWCDVMATVDTTVWRRYHRMAVSDVDSAARLRSLTVSYVCSSGVDPATTPFAWTGVLCEAGAGEGMAHRAGLPV